jgi:hypothetical protein
MDTLFVNYQSTVWALFSQTHLVALLPTFGVYSKTCPKKPFRLGEIGSISPFRLVTSKPPVKHTYYIVWKILYYFVMCKFPLFLCSLFFPFFYFKRVRYPRFVLYHLIWQLRPFLLYKCALYCHFQVSVELTLKLPRLNEGY